MKKTFYVFLLLTCLLLIFISGCDNQSVSNDEIIDKSVQEITVDFDSDLKYELGDDIVIPIAKLMDNNGKEVVKDVTYLFKKPSGKEISSIFPNLKCDEVGEWTITYKYGDISLSKQFNVQDTTAPTIELSNVPGDVFVDENKLYSLPEDIESDLSDIDWSKLKFDLKLNGKNVEFNQNTRKFKATEAGEFTYQITIQDIYGNETTSEMVKWNAKLKDWTDNNLSGNFLASYDSKEYINTVESGDMSDYWHSVPYESWLSEFEGATGVLRLQASPYGTYKCIGYKLNLQKTLSKDDMQNKYVVIKMYTTNNIDEVYFGGLKWIDFTECCENYSISIEKNKWQYLIISQSDLSRCHFFDEGEDGFCAFQLGFGMANISPMVENSDIYIDYVTVIEQLEDVSGVMLNGNILSWNDVDNAIGYTVKEDDKETITTSNQYTVEDVNALITVRANGDYLEYCSSRNETPYIDVSNYKNDEIALFDSEGYEKSVVKNILPHRTADKIETTYLENFDDRNDVLKVSSFNNEVYGFSKGTGDFIIRLPQSCEQKMTVVMKIEKLCSNELLFVVPNTDEKMTVVGLDENSTDWQYVILDYSSVSVKDEIWVELYMGTAYDDTVIYFDAVYDGIKEDDRITKLLNNLADDIEGDYLSDFSSKDYEGTAVKSIIPCRGAKSITAEYLEEYDGAENVLKVTTINNSTFGEIEVGKGEKGIGDIVLKLPKQVTNKVKIRFAVEKCNAEYVKFLIPQTENDIYTIDTSVSGWQIVELSYTNVLVKNEISIMIQGGNGGEDNIFYFDYVTEDTRSLNDILTELSTDLEEDYLSDFSCKDYESTVIKNDYQYRSAETLTAEYLDEYKGASGVVKVTTTNNQASQDGTTGIGDICIALPKAITKKCIIRFLVEKCDATFIQFLYPNTENAMLIIDTSISGWQTAELSYQGLDDKGQIEIMIQGGKAGEENIFYFDYVYEKVIIEKQYDGEDVAKSLDVQEDPFVQDKEWVI